MTIMSRHLSRPVAFLSLLACVALSACGPVKGYPGASRDASEVATIWPSPPDTQIGTIVQSVDGMDVNAEVELTVLPGTRTLVLQLVPYSMQEMNQSGGGAVAALMAMSPSSSLIVSLRSSNLTGRSPMSVIAAMPPLHTIYIARLLKMRQLFGCHAAPIAAILHRGNSVVLKLRMQSPVTSDDCVRPRSAAFNFMTSGQNAKQKPKPADARRTYPRRTPP